MNEQPQESALDPRDGPATAAPESDPNGAVDDGEELARLLAEAALDKKGLDLVIIDVRGKASYSDFLIVATGRNDRHVMAIADAMDDAARPYRTSVGQEGRSHGSWILLDYGDIVVHVFYAPNRRLYDIERLWADAPRLEFEVPPDLRGDQALYEGYEQ